MTDVGVDDDNDVEASKPEERAEDFRKLLLELDLKPTEFARRLRALGDFRTVAAIMRSVQRMSAGDTAVSAEALVIVRMLVNQQRLLDRANRRVTWHRQANGVWGATIEGFHVTLNPQTRDRWHISLVHEETGFSPAWKPWVFGLEAAKRKAQSCVADGLLDMCQSEVEATA